MNAIGRTSPSFERAVGLGDAAVVREQREGEVRDLPASVAHSSREASQMPSSWPRMPQRLSAAALSC